jgi:hypothetical protein
LVVPGMRADLADDLVLELAHQHDGHLSSFARFEPPDPSLPWKVGVATGVHCE